MLALSLAALAGAATYLTVRRPESANSGARSSVRARRSLAVLGFQNLSGRPDAAWLSTALAEMFATEMEAGGGLRIIPGENVARASSDLALVHAVTYSQDTLRKIRRNLGTDLVVSGSYMAVGGEAGKIRLDLHLQDARDGEIITSVSETGSQADLLDLVARTGARLREKLSEGAMPSGSAADTHPPKPQATPRKLFATSNEEAMRFYAEGLNRLRKYDSVAARELLEKAVAADPQNALMHVALANAWNSLGHTDKARAEAKLALDLSAGLPWEQRLRVEGNYDEQSAAWEKALKAYRALFDAYPDNVDYGFKVAVMQIMDQKYPDALATIGGLRKLPPPANGDPRVDLAESMASMYSGDLQHGLDLASRALAKATAASAQSQAARAQTFRGFALRKLGRLSESEAALEAARRVFEVTGDRGNLASALGSLGEIARERGDLEEARNDALARLAIMRDIGNRAGTAGALVGLGGAEINLGDPVASKHLEEALQIYRELGDKSMEAETLNNLAVARQLTGDLPGARRLFQQALELCRAAGDQFGAALHLTNLADVLLDQGNLTQARQFVEQAASICTRIGAGPQLSEAHIVLSEILLEMGHAAEGEATARQALVDLQARKQIAEQGLALALVTRALLVQGKRSEAGQTAEQAAKLLPAIQDPGMRLALRISGAEAHAALGQPAESEAAEALLEATKLGYVGYQFEARLVLAKAELAAGQASASRAHLAALEKDAKAKGYGLIARKAAAGQALSRANRAASSSAPRP